MSRRGAVLFAAMSLIWGVPYLFIRIAVADLHPTVVVAGRCLIGALVLLPFALRSGGVRSVLRRWPVVLVYTVVEVSLPWWLLTDAEQHLSSSFAGLLIAAVPLIGTAIGLLLGMDERLDTRRVVGLLVGFAGVASLLGLDVQAASPWPVVQVLLTATGYAVGPFIVTRSLQGLSAIAVNTVVLTAALLGYLPFAVLHLPRNVPPASSVLSVVVLGVVCTALAFILFFALIAEIGPARAPVITYVNPAVALGAGVVFLAEPVTAGMVVGFPLVLLGSVLATRRGRAAGTGLEAGEQDRDTRPGTPDVATVRPPPGAG